jgi:ketosteroid isomerase-like protein
VRTEFLRAYNAKDIDAVVALYAEDATLVSDGGTFKVRDEIRKWVKSGLDQGSGLEAIDPTAETSSGTLAYGTGRTANRRCGKRRVARRSGNDGSSPSRDFLHRNGTEPEQRWLTSNRLG